MGIDMLDKPQNQNPLLELESTHGIMTTPHAIGVNGNR